MKSRLLIFLFLFITAIAHAQDNPAPDLEPITADNATQLVQLERYGNGLLGNALVWSPDGKTLAVGGSAGLWLYNGDDLNLPPQFIDTDQWVTPQAFNSDGTLLAFSADRNMYLWDVKTQTEIAHFDDSVVAAFSPDGKILRQAA